MVVDDEDFHTLQQVFNLGQQRAIATALNTLVFRSLAPEASAQPIYSKGRCSDKDVACNEHTLHMM